MLSFRLQSAEEAAVSAANAINPDYRDQRHPVQCPTCGRFARAGRDLGQDISGEYVWSVHCKKHGEVWVS